MPTHLIPNPLLLQSGSRISTIADWRNLRRTELLELFREHVYGRNSVNRPEALWFRKGEEAAALDGAAVRREVHICYSGPGGESSFPVTLYLPAAVPKPRGVIVLIINREDVWSRELVENSCEFWPVRDIVGRGYATAAFYNKDVSPDDAADGFKSGVFGVFDPPLPPGGERAANAWGAIAAWSWGASRVVDYLLSEEAWQGVPIAVAGHSRGGKAALWCGAQDERIALTISNNSGNSGAALARTTRGETIEHINRVFPHWFARNYRAYSHDIDSLPVDQHELLALLAPRLAYVCSASEDAHADPHAEFRACVEASEVFRLHGLTGISSESFPAIAQPLHGGSIGYHLREGHYDLTRVDWNYFMDFADRSLRKIN
ncbi:MAG TPA: hypothetical protein VK970_19590 [Candidatus Methylacidiphilales bacterium]|nr:hypothetical protein [Candidatus Methylacidiphilales bacterium]